MHGITYIQNPIFLKKKTDELIETEQKSSHQGLDACGIGGNLKSFKHSDTRWVSSDGLIYNMVNAVENTVVYN